MIPSRSSCFATDVTARSRKWEPVTGLAYDEDGRTFAGMGVDFADYDNDGWPDVFVKRSREPEVRTVSQC